MIAMLAAAAACAMAPADRVWIDAAIVNWRTSEQAILKLAPQPLPTILAIDARCTFTGRTDDRGRVRWTGARHGDPVVLPDGNKAPIGPISFASAGGPAGSYFAMSLPSVWRGAKVASGLGLERLMDGVMLHEFMHARQFYFANPALAALGRQYGFGDAISDDSLQDRFAKDPAYVADYGAELDLLFAAADAPTDVEARAIAGRALASMRARRAKWFVGKDAQWAPLDDIFLTMEGVGQWLAYAFYASRPDMALPKATLLKEVRRGGSQWSQDQGLALFLVIDRLVPDWQRLAFAERPLLAEALLAKAAGAR